MGLQCPVPDWSLFSALFQTGPSADALPMSQQAPLPSHTVKQGDDQLIKNGDFQ